MTCTYLRNLCLGLSLVLLSWPAAAIVYVKADATGANDGSSWVDAYTDLQAALNATASGEIWVAGGIYRPGAAGIPDASFRLKRNVAIYGGFDGTETRRDQRNWTVNVTTLSGDLDQDDSYGTNVWYDYSEGFSGYAGNSLHVVTGSNTDATAILDGFTIIAGANGASLTGDPYAGMGMGMLVVNGSPTVRNCVFKRHLGLWWGAGMYLVDGNPLIERTVFQENYVSGHGAGLATTGTSGPTRRRGWRHRRLQPGHRRYPQQHPLEQRRHWRQHHAACRAGDGELRRELQHRSGPVV
jgi:hypothetical protein